MFIFFILNGIIQVIVRIGVKMDSYKELNKLIEEIENNLKNKIDYQQLAKILGTSTYTMQRIFTFLTGITITEYIRKRRLSKAAEELRKTDHKIIDIAMQYHYDSPVSFSNAFKKMYGESPANFRKRKQRMIVYPKLEFHSAIKSIERLSYRIEEKEEQTFHGKMTKRTAQADSKSIQALYAEAKRDGTMDFLIKHHKGKALYYGIYEEVYKNGEAPKVQNYYLVGKTPRKDFITITIPKAKWACFMVKNHKQKDIVKVYQNIYFNWLPHSEYTEILEYPQIEIYYPNCCEICIAVR